MACIRTLSSGRIQAQIRRNGSKPISRTFRTQQEAEAWADWVERLIERCSSLDGFVPPDTVYLLTIRDAWPLYIGEQGRRPYSWVDELWRSVNVNGKGRANRKGIEFSVTKEDIVAVLKRSEGYCELTGIPFSFYDPCGTGKRLPFAASIDRIDSKIGYTRDNIRAVCFAANVALSHWGVHVFDAVASAYFYRRLNGDHQETAFGEVERTDSEAGVSASVEDVQDEGKCGGVGAVH